MEGVDDDVQRSSKERRVGKEDGYRLRETMR